jgi:hypothetical protein
MFHSRDHNGHGQAGLHLHAARYPYPGEDEYGAYHEPVRPDMTNNTPGAARDLDEVGHAVVPRTIPGFWKPVEDWMLD